MPDWDENAENTLHSMQKTLKRNAILVSGLALFFWWAFGFAKHDPALRSIIPFGEDPYDAVSSFGVILCFGVGCSGGRRNGPAYLYVARFSRLRRAPHHTGFSGWLDYVESSFSG